MDSYVNSDRLITEFMISGAAFTSLENDETKQRD